MLGREGGLSMHTVLVGNFRGRKFSRISWFDSHPRRFSPIYTNDLAFRDISFPIFLPRMFPAIRYQEEKMWINEINHHQAKNQPGIKDLVKLKKMGGEGRREGFTHTPGSERNGSNHEINHLQAKWNQPGVTWEVTKVKTILTVLGGGKML